MLNDVLLTQQRELAQRLQEPYAEREFPAGRLSSDLVNVILGPRRAGKSFFGVRLFKDVPSFGYVNFDDERLVALQDYDELLAAVASVYGNPKHLFLDEIQNLPKWELFVNRLQRQGYHLTVTGSNAHLLSSELATHLTGRYSQIVIFPFSFSEYLRSLNRQLTDMEKAEALRQYAEIGGYPEPLIKGVNRREYLTTLLRATLYKDIVVRRRIRAAPALEDLATYLMSNVAQEYSLRTLAKVTRCKSDHTVDKYLGYLEEAFLFFSLRRFSFKVREQVGANKKIYCIDNGLVTSASFRFSADRGKLYENLVAVALHKHQIQGQAQVFFWKNPQQEEVDFVVKEGLAVTQLVQVCAHVQDPKTREREVRALLKAGEDLKCKNLTVLTDATEAEEEVNWHGFQGHVKFVPLWKWLLKNGRS